MVHVDILDIARTWSFWDRPVPPSVPRSVDLPAELKDSLCTIIQGVRRCGKSTLMGQMIEHYSLDSALCAFVNFEDPRLSRALSFETLEHLVEKFRAMHPDASRLAFFLDEIQEVNGWQRWLRSQLDQPRGHLFIISGSNSTMLSGELSSVLTGRHLSVTLFPFDFGEVRSMQQDATFDNYLLDGGFPEPLTMTDGDRLRRQYFFDIIERDIRQRIGARSSLPIRQVAQMAFESAGAEMSIRRVAGATGIAVDTAARYLEVCEDAHLLYSCPYFAFSERKRASMNRKYYPVDTGLRRVVVTKTGADRGKALECATYIALRRHFDSVYYWRERGEVDFVVRRGQDIFPIQVTWDAPEQRHLDALDAFYERFPQASEAVHVSAETFESSLTRLILNK